MFPATSNGAPPQQCITVVAIDDNLAEDSETILLEMTSTDPPNTNIVNNVNTEVTIIDNDGQLISLPHFTVIHALLLFAVIIVLIGSGDESVLEDVGSVDVIIAVAGSAGNLERNLSIPIMDIPNTALS